MRREGGWEGCWLRAAPSRARSEDEEGRKAPGGVTQRAARKPETKRAWLAGRRKLDRENDKKPLGFAAG